VAKNMENPVPSTATQSEAESVRKLRVEFWTKRLDHTLSHTESSSRLLYLVDGAVLTLLAFVVEKLRPSGIEEIFLVALPVAFLALLNYYHSQIILRQREWYNAIDERIRQILTNEPAVNLKSDVKLGSTHHIYSRIHIAITWFLALVAILVGIHAYLPR
jgi:hypothetical protein